MKKLLFYACTLLCYLNISQAQGIDTTTLGFHDKVSLVIQSDLFIDTLLPGKSIGIVTGHLRIRYVSLKNLLMRTRIISANDSIYSFNSSEIEFNIGGKWKRLQKNSETEVLIDTVIQPGHELEIQFRKVGTTDVIQRTIFKRLDILPSILGYRIMETVDTTPLPTLKANYKYLKLLNAGYKLLGSDHITLKPGQLLSLQVKRINESKDSCIEFRLRKGNTIITNWNLTGHILRLNSLVSNTHYTLDIRYKESGKYISYQIDELPKWFEHTWIEVLLVLFSLSLITSGYFLALRFHRRRKIKARKLLEQQIRNLQAKLNPHFMFNVLGSISGLMAEDEKERAMASLNSFAAMLRETLDNSDRIFISLAKDIAMMKTYIVLEQLRFNFAFSITIDPAINIKDVEIPPMLIQPSIENAIKHGIASSGGEISVLYQARGRDLIITIKDNGIFKANKTTGRTGHGISITKERINNLQKLYPKEKMIYELVHTVNGTIVRFSFSNWL